MANAILRPGDGLVSSSERVRKSSGQDDAIADSATVSARTCRQENSTYLLGQLEGDTSCLLYVSTGVMG
jgi:hypothetical protein